MEAQATLPNRPNIIFPVLGAAAVVFTFMTVLAGPPPADRLVGFAIGILVLIAFTLALGFSVWHLFVRPLPAGVTKTDASVVDIRPQTRNIIALFLTLSTISVGIAGGWDEIWHVKYGIPFGEDFFWRPHLLLYFSFGTMLLTGIWSWTVLMNRSRGTLQQRFRANPLLGLSFFAGMYTIYAVGTDPIWHKLYGADLAPWSLPHLLILILIFMTGMLAVAFHKTLMPARNWQTGFRFSWRDVMIVIVMAGALVDYLLIFTIQWYGARISAGARQLQQILSYPDWLFPLFITFLAVLFGGMALHSTRRIGSATLVGLLAFGVRFFLDKSFGGLRDGTTSLYLIIPMLLAMDVLYAVMIARTKKPPTLWMTAGMFALLLGVVEYPLIAALFPFLPVNPIDIVGRVIASLIAGAATMWLVQSLSDMSAYGDAPEPVAAQKPLLSSFLANASLYVAFAVGILLFIVTATPPVK